MLLEKIVYGTIVIAVGVVTLKYNFQIVNFGARLEWIESKLGSGTTYLVYKLLSITLILGGILYLTGYLDNLLNFLLQPVSNLFPKDQLQ